MHADEVDIDAELVQRLVAGQFREWAGLTVTEIPSSGTVNAMYRLGDSLTVRLPRVPGGVDDIGKEATWLPRLAPLLPVEIPVPVALGEPADEYPWRWSVNRWIDGDLPVAGTTSTTLGTELGELVREFRKITLPDAPAAYRGGPLSEQDAGTRSALRQLVGWIDVEAAMAGWDAGLAAAPATGSVWLHADLMPSNLLVQGDRLLAVLDFATAGTGDPACDLIPAWNLLTGPARTAFRAAVDVDEDTWIRGRARALSMALIQLPYYRETNPGIAANAQYVIDQVVADVTGAPA
ncbi:aminoglycoside phosphotransferase (APT) family kinase protein [Kribbella amoyensis]|uniref:Aminoglycoside phosphotransferase (APT) family kinase protein n=1 Tax=Kribbella amoyensis TaxID=996641 RepID=A0A561B3T6_9ACTN|nr:aminoglycoside phosphotransferase family protein [Kribbella amoyensis]TWD73452.1 aminoglycoside phosphotransferase (APT) family kinase protein [Kribbella amoyensis]